MEDVPKRILSDLKEFLKYLASAWGLLSTITPLFPLFDRFRDLLPPPRLYSQLFVLLATLSGIFVVFYCFSHRDAIGDVSAVRRFFYAVFITVFYSIVMPALPGNPIGQQLGLSPTEPITQLVLSVLNAFWLAISPILYVLIFYLFTQAFAVSAVRELRRRER